MSKSDAKLEEESIWKEDLEVQTKFDKLQISKTDSISP